MKVIHYMMLNKLLLVSIFLFTTASQACLSPQYEDYVLLESLPSTANEQAVVAKVKLIADKGRSGTVRVIEAIKGVVAGQEFEAEVEPWSCSYLESRVRFNDGVKKETASDIYFLAGNWRQSQDQKVFVGGWRNGEKVAYRKLD